MYEAAFNEILRVFPMRWAFIMFGDEVSKTGVGNLFVYFKVPGPGSGLIFRVDGEKVPDLHEYIAANPGKRMTPEDCDFHWQWLRQQKQAPFARSS